MPRLFRVVPVSCIAIIALLLANTAYAQVAIGTYPYGTFDNKGFDTVNVGNLNVHFSIPILNKTGRGVSLYYNLSFDSSVWYPRVVGGSSVWTPVQSFGWAGDTEIAAGYVTYAQLIVTRGACMIITNYNWVYYDTFGVAHAFQGSTRETIPSGSQTCSTQSPPSPLTVVATDNSGYTLNVTGMSQVQLSSASGAQIHPPVSYGTGTATYTDNNGNQIVVDSGGHITDTTGTVALTIAGAAPSAHTFAYTDTTGTSRSVSMSYVSYPVRTNFQCSGVTEYGPITTSLVDTITLPNNNTYHFTYEPTPGYASDVTGRIASVTLPTGGVIHYSYSGGSSGIVCADGSAAGLTRSISSDSGSAGSAWIYSRSVSGSTSSTTVTDGLNNVSSYTFVLGGPQTGQTIGLAADLYETGRTMNQGSSTALVSRSTCYNGSAPPCTTTALSLPIAQIDTYESFNGGLMRGAQVKYNTYGLTTDEFDYDFGTTTSRGSLLRHEAWTYPTSGIANLLSADQIYDGVGTLTAKTTYWYDTNSLTASSGIPNHIAVSGQRGNLTAISSYYNSSSYVGSSFTYEDTGSVLTASTPNGTASYTYSANYVYPQTSVAPTPSSGVQLGTSSTYDSNTGLLATATDANGTVATYAYNDMLSPTTVTTTDSSHNTVGLVSYNPESANQSGVIAYQSATVSEDTETLLDGYGRGSRIALSNGQSGNPWYQRDACYDGNGNLSFASYPYQSTGFSASKQCSGSGDVYTYDALGRPITVTHADSTTVSYSYTGRATQITDEAGVVRVYQVDGLGRTTAVCEVSSNGSMPGGSGSPAACGLDIGAIGFLTTYAYSFSNHSTTVTQGSQTRTFQTDWLGRPTLIQEPESGQTTYSYAYNSTGLLVTRVRPKENQTNPNVLRTTYSQYDSVGRLVEKWVDDSSTPTKYFYYDTQQWGINPPLQNPKGRLTWHVDMVGSAGTGSVYSYDPMGRVLQIWSCTPTTCGHAAYTGIYTYDWLGNMLTSGDGSGVTDTYTYSPANEVQSITSSLNNSTNPPQLVSNVQNGPFGSTSWQLGNGFTAVRQYDTMGRPAGGWVCQGSSQPWCTGGGDYYYFESWWTGSYLTQSCDSAVNLCNRYGYDSFGRLTSLADMYGPLTYSWVYDRWGNRWQQTPAGGAGSTENVTFNGNNQINSSGFGYDAAGNMTVDPYHTYTYDAEGNLTQVGPGSTASYSYDSLNHRVATTQGGTSEEFLFNPSGQRVSIWQPNQGALGTQIQGQTYWGGMPVEFYQNGQAHFQHQEWLGTERMRTSYNGGVEGTYTSLPFGDALTTTSGTDLDPYHFAGLDHDYSSDTDHAQFRQYSSAPGRWMSPDPYGGSYDQSNPQTFNRYSYAMNNPLGIVDPSGLCPPPGRDGTPQPCYSGGDGGDQGMIDGIDEFDFMEIPVYGYGFGYIPYQSWSGSVNGTPYTAGMVNWGWGIVPLGTGFDFLGGWMPGGNDGQGSDSGGGKASAPNNAQQSKAQQCNAAINSIPGSKVVQFFSLYNLVTNFKNAWVDWTILPGLKIAALTGAKAVSSSIGGTQVLSVTGGTSTVLSGQAAEVIGAGEAAGSEVATPAIALATEMDLAAHQGCNNPGTTSFAGPILFF